MNRDSRDDIGRDDAGVTVQPEWRDFTEYLRHSFKTMERLHLGNESDALKEDLHPRTKEKTK